jgi:hypothetical protein
MWLMGLAQDLIEHGTCVSCRRNAAQGLAELGMLDEMLTHVGIADPRTLPRDREPRTGSLNWVRDDPLGNR